MYRIIWNWISKLNIERKQKQQIFIAANVVLYMLIGLILWLAFGMKKFNGDPGWFICFVGYPSVLLGFAGSVLSLFKLDQ